jgi:cellulose synthase/poly-beta-1,6-N-acetylglucosamine synthase-like glycosyltransferase
VLASQRDLVLETSLSIVIPTHNAESVLAGQVERALEMAAELTARFEILVFDDASRDNSLEIAQELSRQYPQVRIARNVKRAGKSQAIKAAMEQTSGDVVVIYDPAAPMSGEQLRRLWAMRDDSELVIAQAEPETPMFGPGLLERLTRWGESLKRSMQQEGRGGGMQMIRRRAVNELRLSPFPERELVLDRIDGAECVSRGGHARPSQTRPKAPTLLTRLKGFAGAE